MHKTHETMPHINPKLAHIESRYKSKPKELTNVFSSMEKQKRKDLLQSVKNMNLRLLNPTNFKKKRSSSNSRGETHRSKKKIESVSDILRTQNDFGYKVPLSTIVKATK